MTRGEPELLGVILVTHDIQTVGRETRERMRCGEKSAERLRKKRDPGVVKRGNPKSSQHRKILSVF